MNTTTEHSYCRVAADAEFGGQTQNQATDVAFVPGSQHA